MLSTRLNKVRCEALRPPVLLHFFLYSAELQLVSGSGADKCLGLLFVVLDASTPDHRHSAQQQRCRKHNCDNLWPHLRGAADPSAWYLHVVLWRDSDSNFLQTKQ